MFLENILNQKYMHEKNLQTEELASNLKRKQFH